jgi:hypothetical protein
MNKKNRKIAFALFGLMLVHASAFVQTHTAYSKQSDSKVFEGNTAHSS